MRRLALILCPLIALAFPPVGLANVAKQRQQLRAAHARTTLIAPAPQYQRWLDRIQLPTAPAKVVVSNSPIDAGRGTDTAQTYPSPGQVNIAISPSALVNTRRTFDHEMGHALWDGLSAPQQQHTLALMHATRPAFDGQPNPPGEQFAELYRVLAEKGGALSSRAAYHRMAGNESIGYMSRLPHYFQMRKLQQYLMSL